MNRTVSVVVSVYNEEQALPAFYKETTAVLTGLKTEKELRFSWDYEILFVNDGSSDGSQRVLEALAERDKRVRVISFSRNFGHEAAMIAGLDYSSGHMVVCMDADLQHPPECILEILKSSEKGFEVINMVRTKNRSAGFFKNLTSAGFYWFINAVSDVRFEANASDFFAVSRRVAEVLKKNYREKVRFLRGYVQNLGFSRINLEYEAHDRIAGKSKYSLKKLFAFAVNTILCFSNMPLKLGIYAGLCSGGLGIFMMAYTIGTWVKVGAPPGYATIVVLICFMFSVLFFLVGIIGEYIAILFNELKDRPVYIVEEMRNFGESEYIT